MEGPYNTSQPNGRSTASWWIFVLVALVVGGLIGYYLGASGVGTGLVPEEGTDTTETDVSTNAEVTTQDEPANPFEDDGYQNPFE